MNISIGDCVTHCDGETWPSNKKTITKTKKKTKTNTNTYTFREHPWDPWYFCSVFYDIWSFVFDQSDQKTWPGQNKGKKDSDKDKLVENTQSALLVDLWSLKQWLWFWQHSQLLRCLLKPELNIQVGCNQVIKIGKGKVVERGDVEEVVEILNIQIILYWGKAYFWSFAIIHCNWLVF